MERRDRSVLAAAWRTLAVALGVRRLRTLAGQVPEPVEHGRWIAALAVLRCAPWLVTVGVLVARMLDAEIEIQPLLPIHRIVDAPLARALSAWSLLLVPVGVPLVYFMGGLLPHLGLVLTGGARWPLSATLRALALAFAPLYLAVGIVELLAWAHLAPARIVFGLAAAAFAHAWIAGTVAVAATHRIGVFWGAAVVAPGLAAWAVVFGARLALVVGTMPGLDVPPPSPYAIDVSPP
ncbi:MAG: hypothetical protein D6705_07000 [Deltaproteobacteria bacterium]|nr:MAG: hypothetical protein D6705_07000 [Deltaproteobacteria bacterium]